MAPRLLHYRVMKFLVSMLAFASLAACMTASGDDGGGGADSTPDSRCASGLRWTGGNSESPLMHPGGDCIGCHSSGEGPRFLVAGTVSASLDEPADCFGVEGAVVTITDANGTSIDATSNAAGNFYISARQNLAMPIHASVQLGGHVNAMGAAQSTGACASCHTATGTGGAPGRILAP